MPHNNPKLNTTIMVYVAKFDSDVKVGEVQPYIRNLLIHSCSDNLAKQQRYCVWKLLDKALHDCYGGGIADFGFYVDGNGKWNTHNCIELSLAHSNNVVVVALCNHYVGVDIEEVSRFERHVDDAQFAERVLCDNEIALLRNTPIEHKAELLATMWTKKESFFKFGGRSEFVPKSTDTTSISIHSQIVTIDGANYALSVARCIPSKIELVQVQI